jgi:uncharacterized RDD family membrane protein YckC
MAGRERRSRIRSSHRGRLTGALVVGGDRMAMGANDQRRSAPPSGAPGLGARLGARLIDALVLVAIGAPMGVALEFSVAWLVGQALLVFVYFVALDVAWGTTIGKRVLGLRVSGAHGGHPGVGEAAVREAFTLLGAVPYAGPVLALGAWIAIGVTARSSEHGQGVHDRLAGGTRVQLA